MARITDLPAEILVRIFQFYLEEENQHKLMNVMPRVCQMWKAVCQNNALWAKFDGTVKYEKMMKLCSRGCLNYTKEFKISKTKCLNDKDAEQLFSRLKNIELINLSQVESFSKNIIMILAKNDANFKEILIQRKRLSKKPLILRYAELETFFSFKGGNLTTIKLSYCTIQNPSLVLKYLSECCPNLEHFHFTDNALTIFGLFPTKHFQLNCKKLKILHLDNIKFGIGKHPLGFLNLEVFTYNDQSLLPHIKDKDIECILFNSPNLKFLSLTNCSISVETLCSLPANSVEYLFLSRSKIVNSVNLPDIFKKWCYSLKQVDISYSNKMSVNGAVLELVTVPVDPPIEFLDLSFTQITSDSVKTILEKCQRIKMLNLNACRNLNRGLKRKYSGETELKTLLEKIRASMYDDSTDEEMAL